MKKLWIGSFLISMMWLLLLPILTPTHWIYLLFLSFGLAFNIWALWDLKVEKINPLLYLFIIPILVFPLLIPYPFNLGAILMLAGVILTVIQQRYKIPHSLSLGSFLTGIILLAQTVLFPFYSHFAARYHRVGIADSIMSLLAKIAGLSSSFDSKSLIIQTSTGPSPFLITLESLGLYPFLNILIAGAMLMTLFSSEVRRPFLIFLAVASGYSIIRSPASLSAAEFRFSLHENRR